MVQPVLCVTSLVAEMADPRLLRISRNFCSNLSFLRKLERLRTLVVVLVLLGYVVVCTEGQECNLECEHGRCVDNKCICDPGWKGSLCQWCEGRVR